MTAASRSLGELLKSIRDGWPGSRWEWDGRFGCALATVDAAGMARARELLASLLPDQFTASTVSGAPASVAQICAKTGGLRGDQEILTVDGPAGGTAYCLWWPWGGNQNFSARVGVNGGPDAGPALLKTAFGL